MKNIIIAFLILMLFAGCLSNSFGQMTVVGAGMEFDKYHDYLQKEDVTVTVPDGYSEINMDAQSRDQFFTSFGPEPYYHYRGAVGLQSPDKHAVFVYPALMSGADDVTELGWLPEIALELTDIYGRNEDNFRSNIEIISGKDLKAYANADTVAIYHIDFKVTGINFMDKYNHCVSVGLRKAGHPGLLLRIMLDDEGYKEKDKYLRRLLDSISYGDNAVLKNDNVRGFLGFEKMAKDGARWPAIDSEKRTKYRQILRDKWKAENDSLGGVSAD